MMGVMTILELFIVAMVCFAVWAAVSPRRRGRAADVRERKKVISYRKRSKRILRPIRRALSA